MQDNVRSPSRRYFDHAAATPPLPEAITAYTRAAQGFWANSSSLHREAQMAEDLLETSRESLAAEFDARPEELVFTASGTESDNLALRGALRAQAQLHGKRHVLTSPVEHPAVAATLEDLALNEGFSVEKIPVDHHGRVAPSDLKSLLRSDTALVSVIWGNNEIGTLNPIADCASLCRANGTMLHTDAVQAGTWMRLSFRSCGADLISLSGRKWGAPSGGLLLVRQGTPLRPILTGGPQESGRRAGTHDIAAAAAMAAAARGNSQRRQEHTARISGLRDFLRESLLAAIPHCTATGAPSEHRLPNHLSLIVEGLDGNTLCRHLDLLGFAASPGAACKTGRPGPSTVLLALGYSEVQAKGGLRITLGWETSTEDVEALARALPEVVERARRNQGGRV